MIFLLVKFLIQMSWSVIFHRAGVGRKDERDDFGRRHMLPMRRFVLHMSQLRI